MDQEIREYAELLADPKAVPVQETAPDDTSICFNVTPPGGSGEMVELIGMKANGDFYF
ncbi:MAG: hypothetical protein MUP21_13540 [Dehalococcoidia bacterium]|nr:hypothetical protein [Dehalococcoidia bacterium]